MRLQVFDFSGDCDSHGHLFGVLNKIFHQLKITWNLLINRKPDHSSYMESVFLLNHKLKTDLISYLSAIILSLMIYWFITLKKNHYTRVEICILLISSTVKEEKTGSKR